MTREEHHCDKTPEDWSCEYHYAKKWIVDGPDQECGIFEPIYFCPWCGIELDTNDEEPQQKIKPKSQLQILQEKKDAMAIIKDMVNNLNKYVDELFNQNEKI